MSANDLKAEVEKVGKKLLTKLNNLPQADIYEIVSFTVILVFIALVFVLVAMACCYSCCDGHTKKHRFARVQPTQAV
ncbi:hypothetical protein GDO86_013989 [Hymenochirus boettgeri]|uniref:Small integral membrane protein 5 n=1 Tax=Hymenochirus boettgeri TaxID=247094 RepID=A0A8T2JRA4_9PIPI|nr:hypothetical protein GDO86_013989 [Hymenochirus boettgeri]